MAEPTSRQSRAKAAAAADEPTAEPTTAEPTAESTAEPTTEDMAEGMEDVEVSVTQLIDEGPDFLGQPSFVVAGALSGHDPAEVMAVGVAQSEVNDWLQSPVKVEGDEEG